MYVDVNMPNPCPTLCATWQDETVTSLAYAARVKLITNNANKNQDSEEVAKLKAIIKALKVGKAVGLAVLVYLSVYVS